ncbi:hypothetical protein [Caldovatus aquaticus]|uniref:Uncharacterized protein n=1 Tax=Caldovatus aquaticus TaxID=2865671 RepID=A0ABS7F786_9PROT|nr:hypothetical protein [Caldovatus aquaticus]MBW8271488.1 hypothetical protein [Caldovatus aquaticus]
MPLYLLEPVRARLADPAWSASLHRSFCLVAARSEGQARELAARTLTRADGSLAEADASPSFALEIRAGKAASRRPTGSGATPRMPSPWLQLRLVEAREMPLAALADAGGALADAGEPRIVLPAAAAVPLPPTQADRAASAGTASAMPPDREEGSRPCRAAAPGRKAAAAAPAGASGRPRKAKPTADRRTKTAKPAIRTPKRRVGMPGQAKPRKPAGATRARAAARAVPPKRQTAAAARRPQPKRNTRPRPGGKPTRGRRGRRA